MQEGSSENLLTVPGEGSGCSTECKISGDFSGASEASPSNLVKNSRMMKASNATVAVEHMREINRCTDGINRLVNNLNKRARILEGVSDVDICQYPLDLFSVPVTNDDDRNKLLQFEQKVELRRMEAAKKI